MKTSLIKTSQKARERFVQVSEKYKQNGWNFEQNQKDFFSTLYF